jgi:molybdate-binding protein
MMARRPDGAGAQQLLEALLRREQIAEKRLKIALTAPTGPDIAQAIRSGEVDCGIATRTVALAAGIDFVPLTRERFDLLMRQRDSYRPALQTLLRFLASPRLKTRAAELGGLDAAPAGEIRWAP